MALLELAQELPAVDSGHHDVEEHELGCLVLDRLERARRVRGLRDRVAREIEVDRA